MEKIIEQKLKELVNLIADYNGFFLNEPMTDIYVKDDKNIQGCSVEIDEDVMTLRIDLTKI